MSRTRARYPRNLYKGIVPSTHWSTEVVELRSWRTSVRPATIGLPACLPELVVLPAANSVVAPKANHRHDVRTRVSFTACVRQAGGQEIVEYDNISRGGLLISQRQIVGHRFDVRSCGSLLTWIPGHLCLRDYQAYCISPGRLSVPLRRFVWV
jgi:hypothetical protein